ncbi:hypothetical protein [Streptomyces sp. NPDC014344]|uniref:hypothetical protein n=1 Tax=Streptomyces sp. NPDC014344 TaxID=3364871 RepID=UPI0036FEC616
MRREDGRPGPQDDVEADLDELYALPPSDFVARREERPARARTPRTETESAAARKNGAAEREEARAAEARRRERRAARGEVRHAPGRAGERGRGAGERAAALEEQLARARTGPERTRAELASRGSATGRPRGNRPAAECAAAAAARRAERSEGDGT